MKQTASRPDTHSLAKPGTPFRLAAMLGLLAAAGTLTASAALVTFVGGETSSTGSGNWGTTVSAGYKSGFRSTDTDTKGYVLPGNQNAYGADGYIVFGSSDNSQFNSGRLKGTLSSSTSVTNATGVPGDPNPIFNGPASYIGSLSISGTYTSTSAAGWYVAQGGFGIIDNPTAGIGMTVGDMDYGVLFNNPTSGATNTVFDVFTFTLSSTASFRMGVMTGTGDNQKPALMNLIGDNTATATMTGVNNYNRPDWYYFDVTGTVGESFTLQIQQNAFGSNTGISAIVFDSVPEPSSAVLLGLAGMVLMGRRSRRPQRVA